MAKCLGGSATADERGKRFLFQTTGVARVTRVNLLEALFFCDAELRCIGDDDVYIGADMRCVIRGSLPHQRFRRFRGYAAERLPCGVYGVFSRSSSDATRQNF